jgi:hypothetical protein
MFAFGQEPDDPAAKRRRAVKLDQTTGLPELLKTAEDIFDVSSGSEAETSPNNGPAKQPSSSSSAPFAGASTFAEAARDPLLQEALATPPLPPQVNAQRDLALASGAPSRVKKAFGPRSGDVVEAPTLGRLYVTKARDRTYVQYKNAETSGQMRHLFTISQARCPGDGHRDLAYQLRSQIVENDLSREEAVRLCHMAVANFHAAG